MSTPKTTEWQPGDEIPESVLDAVAAAIGDAYDCNRVWSAWSYGTMGPDDFSRVAEDGDRVAEIAGAALEAAHAVLTPPPGCAQAAQPADVALLQSALTALEYHRDHTRPSAQTEAVIEALRAALAAKGGDHV